MHCFKSFSEYKLWFEKIMFIVYVCVYTIHNNNIKFTMVNLQHFYNLVFIQCVIKPRSVLIWKWQALWVSAIFPQFHTSPLSWIDQETQHRQITISYHLDFLLTVPIQGVYTFLHAFIFYLLNHARMKLFKFNDLKSVIIDVILSKLYIKSYIL